MKRIYKIINGVLFDTSIAKYSHTISLANGICDKVRKGSWDAFDVYVYKDGTIFLVNPRNNIVLPNVGDIKAIKETMSPEVYKKYYPLIIPGEDKMIKEIIKDEPKNRLSKVEE